MPQFLATTDPDFDARFAAFLDQRRETDADVDGAVAAILADVAAHGDAAVIALTERVRPDAAHAGHACLLSGPRSTRRRRVAPMTAPRSNSPPAAYAPTTNASDPTTQAGPTKPARSRLALDRRRRRRPLRSGRPACYPSSVLMNAIPARVAGVDRLVICAPTPDGRSTRWFCSPPAFGGLDRLPYRRRPGDRGIGLRHREHRRGRQDHRTRQRLRGRGQRRSSAGSAST